MQSVTTTRRGNGSTIGDRGDPQCRTKGRRPTRSYRPSRRRQRMARTPIDGQRRLRPCSQHLQRSVATDPQPRLIELDEAGTHSHAQTVPPTQHQPVSGVSEKMGAGDHVKVGARNDASRSMESSRTIHTRVHAASRSTSQSVQNDGDVRRGLSVAYHRDNDQKKHDHSEPDIDCSLDWATDIFLYEGKSDEAKEQSESEREPPEWRCRGRQLQLQLHLLR